MKIYILGDEDYDGLNIKGVFSTREKAIEAIPYKENCGESDIHEYELDPPNEGDKFELRYMFSIETKNEGFKDPLTWSSSYRQRPSEFKEFEFGQYSHTRTHGYGKTPEEAEANARKAQLELHPIWQIWEKSCGEARHSHPSLIQKGTQCGSYAVHEDYNVAKIAIMEYMATGKLSPYLTVVK